VLAADISILENVQRGEVILETGLSYDGITPVCVRATKREGRFEFSDDGGAVTAAGLERRRLAFPASIAVGERSVNVSRQGAVWLPAFPRSSDQWLTKVPELVAEGSLALYAALIDLQD
jgi:hypothetical protein